MMDNKKMKQISLKENETRDERKVHGRWKVHPLCFSFLRLLMLIALLFFIETWLLVALLLSSKTIINMTFGKDLWLLTWKRVKRILDDHLPHHVLGCLLLSCSFIIIFSLRFLTFSWLPSLTPAEDDNHVWQQESVIGCFDCLKSEWSVRKWDGTSSKIWLEASNETFCSCLQCPVSFTSFSVKWPKVRQILFLWISSTHKKSMPSLKRSSMQGLSFLWWILESNKWLTVWEKRGAELFLHPLNLSFVMLICLIRVTVPVAVTQKEWGIHVLFNFRDQRDCD